MCKSSFFWQLFDSQRVNGSKTLPKSAHQHFYTTLPLISKNLSWKRFLLVISEIFGLFVEILTADDKYCRHTRENFLAQSQKILSYKPKAFLDFSLRFLNLHQVLSIFLKTMSVIVSLFAK